MIGLGGGDRKRTIHDCALEGDIAALENLVREKPALLRSKDDSGREAFHWAVSRLFVVVVNKEVVITVLSAGAMLSWRGSYLIRWLKLTVFFHRPKNFTEALRIYFSQGR